MSDQAGLRDVLAGSRDHSGAGRTLPAFRRRIRGALWALALAGFIGAGALSASDASRTGEAAPDEPITPIPQPSADEALKVALGARLFYDRRLSRDNSRSCSSCHDVTDNGASRNPRDVAFDGTPLALNTSTVFNAALSFRLNWEGTSRSLKAQARASLENPRIMGASLPAIVVRLRADPGIVRHFDGVYGRLPQAEDVIDALASFERSLLTPDSRFDMWLAGEEDALSAQELNGYRLFSSLGCVSCHQGVNVGGNLFQRHGIFRPLASPRPEVLRVPSLRNIATTAPYFHDGSAGTLDEAVRKMAAAQLNAILTDDQVVDIIAYLNTLTGRYLGRPVGEEP